MDILIHQVGGDHEYVFFKKETTFLIIKNDVLESQNYTIWRKIIRYLLSMFIVLTIENVVVGNENSNFDINQYILDRRLPNGFNVSKIWPIYFISLSIMCQIA